MERSRAILKAIYEQIYSKKMDFTINVFLCGADASRKDSIRYLIYDEIKDDPKYNIVFPEWLFSDLLVARHFNLLNLENELANEVDVIVLPLEGYGTMAELGAFAVSDRLNTKILVINKKEYQRDRSFITLGPVKLIASKKKENVIYYDKHKLDELKKHVLNRIKHLRRIESKFHIKNLFNLSRFILYVIAIFQPVTRREIDAYLDDFIQDFSSHFVAPCIRILFEKKKIELKLIKYEEHFVLSQLGHKFVYEELLSELDIIKNFSQMRARIINTRLRKQNKLNLDEERNKFLVS